MADNPSVNRALGDAVAKAAADPSAPRGKRMTAPPQRELFTSGSEFSAPEEHSQLSIGGSQTPAKKPAPAQSVTPVANERVGEESDSEGEETDAAASSTKAKGGSKSSQWRLCYERSNNGDYMCTWVPTSANSAGNVSHEGVFPHPQKSANLQRHMSRWHPKIWGATKNAIESGQNVAVILASLKRLQGTDANLLQSKLNFANTTLHKAGQLEREVALVMWLAATGIPLNTIEHPTFLEMLTAFNVHIRSRTSIARNVIPPLVSHVEVHVDVRLKAAHGVSISLDGWDASGGRKVLGAVANVLSESLELSRHVFCVTEIAGRSTAALIAALLEVAILRRIGPNRAVSSVVTDHGVNFVLAAKQQFGDWWGCTCHFLQLAVEDGMKSAISDLSLSCLSLQATTTWYLSKRWSHGFAAVQTACVCFVTVSTPILHRPHQGQQHSHLSHSSHGTIRAGTASLTCCSASYSSRRH